MESPLVLLVRDDQLYIVDARNKELVQVDLKTKARRTVARNLPVGVAPGVTAKPLVGLAPFSGPQGTFAGIAAGADGTFYLAGDAEGSVLALREAK
jgi:hypothetical protein